MRKATVKVTSILVDFLIALTSIQSFLTMKKDIKSLKSHSEMFSCMVIYSYHTLRAL
jgi:hypothetical protein